MPGKVGIMSRVCVSLSAQMCGVHQGLRGFTNPGLPKALVGLLSLLSVVPASRATDICCSPHVGTVPTHLDLQVGCK